MKADTLEQLLRDIVQAIDTLAEAQKTQNHILALITDAILQEEDDECTRSPMHN